MSFQKKTTRALMLEGNIQILILSGDPVLRTQLGIMNSKAPLQSTDNQTGREAIIGPFYIKEIFVNGTQLKLLWNGHFFFLEKKGHFVSSTWSVFLFQDD